MHRGGFRKVSTFQTSLSKNLKQSPNDDREGLEYESHTISLLFGPFYERVSATK